MQLKVHRRFSVVCPSVLGLYRFYCQGTKTKFFEFWANKLPPDIIECAICYHKKVYHNTFKGNVSHLEWFFFLKKKNVFTEVTRVHGHINTLSRTPTHTHILNIVYRYIDRMILFQWISITSIYTYTHTHLKRYTNMRYWIHNPLEKCFMMILWYYH